jgi:hypothetical protein
MASSVTEPVPTLSLVHAVGDLAAGHPREQLPVLEPEGVAVLAQAEPLAGHDGNPVGIGHDQATIGDCHKGESRRDNEGYDSDVPEGDG